MKIHLLSRILLVCFLVLAANHLRAAEEQDLIATLQSTTAGAPQKWAACQKLRLTGTARSVPALAALLGEERVAHGARYALEGMPIPEAGAALREALGKTAGLFKVGIIDSLGWRREPESVLLLTPLVSDADATIAACAASALGRIGGKSAIAALSGVSESAPNAVRPTVQEALLKCAERLLAEGDHADAAPIYRGLFEAKVSPQVHAAAWRGLVLSDPAQRAERITPALMAPDNPTHVIALKVIRELNDAAVTKACVAQWATLPADSQLAVLDADVKLGAQAASTIQAASKSPHLGVRVAAWQALGEMSEVSELPALAKAAARGEPTERAAARETLTRVRGPGIREALLGQINQAEPPEKAELLRALGERGDTAAANLLVENAGADSEPVRLAALESLSRLAVADTIAPLLGLAAKSTSDAQRDAVLKALYAVCEASPNKDQTARSVIESIGQVPTVQRRKLLPLLGELGTGDALSAAEAATKDPDAELAKEAVHVLAQWPNAAPAPGLLELARSSTDPTLQTLALRGAIEVAGEEPNPSKRLATLEQALAMAKRPEEKKQALGQIGQVAAPEALEVVLKALPNPALEKEAGLAAVTIAEKLAPGNPKLGDEVAAKVLAQCKSPDIVKRAWALRLKPSSGASFIRDWVACGPYQQAGVAGATAVFNLAFGPEKPGEKVEWRRVPRADHVNLMALFPNQDNCVAYLMTQVLAPEAGAGALLMGSDDGVKAWLNGEVVHNNNVDRGEVADQDVAPITLKKGANQLVLKITQGGGGWSACARIVGADGKPIPGLLLEIPTNLSAPVVLKK